VVVDGKNKFGGDTAEIYAHRVAEFQPNETIKPFDQRQARETLCEILELFAAKRHVDVHVEDEPFIVHGDRTIHWFWNAPFDHRIHVTIKKRH
jgi:hypothetical protein